jgi:hypothetical protein
MPCSHPMEGDPGTAVLGKPTRVGRRAAIVCASDWQGFDG